MTHEERKMVTQKLMSQLLVEMGPNADTGDAFSVLALMTASMANAIAKKMGIVPQVVIDEIFAETVALSAAGMAAPKFNPTQN